MDEQFGAWTPRRGGECKGFCSTSRRQRTTRSFCAHDVSEAVYLADHGVRALSEAGAHSAPSGRAVLRDARRLAQVDGRVRAVEKAVARSAVAEFRDEMLGLLFRLLAVIRIPPADQRHVFA